MNGVPPYNSPYQNGYWQNQVPGGYPPVQIPYWETQQWKDKKKIRHISNVMGWANFAVQALMTALMLGCQWVLFYVIGYPIRTDLLVSGGMSSTMYYFLVSTVYIIAVALPFVLCVVFMKISVNEAFPFQRVRVGWGILWILFGVGFCMLTNIPANIIAILIESMGFSGTLPESVMPNTTLALILNIIEIAVIPPLVEELAFRGVILSQLRKFGNGFAVFGSALLFAFYHGNFLQFTFTFFVGLVLGFIMIRTNNLWIPIIIHALNNGISLLFSLVADQISEQAYEVLNVGLFYGLMVVGLIAFVILLLKKRECFQRHFQPGLLSFSSRLGAFITNPGFIAFFALFLLTAIVSLQTW